MLWAILIAGIVAALAAVGAETNTRNVKTMILLLERDKDELKAEIEFNRSKIDQLLQDVFDLKMELRGVRRRD